MDPRRRRRRCALRSRAVLEDRKVGDVVYFLGQILGLEFLDSPLIKAIEGISSSFICFAARSSSASSRRTRLPSVRRRGGQRRGPIVLVFDDLHGAHHDSLDLLAYLIETLRAPILLVCIGRPELRGAT